ncbi:MAG: rhamnogalacturonan acetylesterase [Bacteroidaceae bacterium]|nr:rhamnogalacturonan acetylesterase [Bacteroidaceae bacterium]
MKQTLSSLLCAAMFSLPILLSAQTYSFDGRDKSAIQVKPTDVFTPEKGYGYDFQYVIDEARKSQNDTYQLSDGIFYFSVAVPDGNYKVTVTLGSKKMKGNTTVRAESRRLFVQNAETKKGEFKTYSFVVNKRNTIINLPDGKTDRVRIKKREETKMNWDDKLTIEVNGDAPAVSSILIEPANDVPTLWLCGNSTVVDQDYEPWASWGQMITRWFTDEVAVANYAESGETATSFIGAGRLKKIVSLMKQGDYIFMEFGHNDQKEKRPGSGAFYNYAYALKQFVDEARAKGVTPIFVTPTQRRSFDKDGKIQETHANYPEAMRWVAKDLGVQIIELHDMTRTFYETLGVEGSKHALVHYPAGTYPGQAKAFEDNTHFNPYGAYEIAKMMVEGMKSLNLPVVQHLRPDYITFDPSSPDGWKTFHWNDGPFIDIVKPDGN